MSPRARSITLDPIGVIEACYASHDDGSAWLKGVLDALAPLDQGHGSYAAAFDFGDHERGSIEVVAERGELPAGWLDAGLLQPPNPALVRAFYAPHPPVDRATNRARLLSPSAAKPFREFCERVGVYDAIGILGCEPDGHGVMVGIPTNRGPLPARTRHQLARIAAHLVSANRLRMAQEGQPVAPEDRATEAILDPSGKVQHALGGAKPSPARERLAEAVRRVERARGSLRKSDPDEAVDLWRGLVAGEWSLVDHCEKDGRRLVLARKNSPDVRDPRALTARERQVLAFAAMGHSNKYIAYLLGLTPSGAAWHLSTARRKLGLRSRHDVIQVIGPLLRVPRRDRLTR